MPSIRLQNMGGIAPRVSPRLLPLSAAQIAEGTQLWSGEVRAFHTGKVLPDELPTVPLQTIFHVHNAWLAWQQDVDVVIGFTAEEALGRIYYTGDGGPKVIPQLIAAGEAPTPHSAFPLGVIPPVFAPICTTTPPGSPMEFRSYVFTWVTNYGEESVPSPASDVLQVEDGVAVEVKFGHLPLPALPTPPDNLPPVNVTRARIYRSNGGPFIFVVDVPWSVGVYNDVLTNDEIEGNEQLVSQHWYPPNSKLMGLIGTANGFLAGFWDNKVGFSEPYQPHAWPPEFVKIFDYPIVALGTYGSTVVVFTEGYTYLVDGIDPRNLSVARVPDTYPCVSKRSVSTGDQGVYYASTVGLGFVGTRDMRIVTKDLMSEDDWLRWNPTTMHGTVFDGFYFGFFRSNMQTDSVDPQGRGFMFDVADRATESYAKALLINIPFYATAVFASPDVRLHYVTAHQATNTLNEWDRGAEYAPYRWRSKELVFPFYISFGAGKVVVQCDEKREVRVRLLDGKCRNVLYERAITNSEPFRLPAIRSRLDWAIEVVGTAAVSEVHFATSMSDLKEGDQ